MKDCVVVEAKKSLSLCYEINFVYHIFSYIFIIIYIREQYKYRQT